jgi:hypothetical protein
MLTPKNDWHDSFILEYFDMHHPFQRFIKYENGANGIYSPVESLWIEVPAGNKLILRNLRLRHGEPTPWLWLVGILVFILSLALLVAWAWRKTRRNKASAAK